MVRSIFRRSARHRRSGSAAIEFALCLPIWFAVIVAIADFGWLFLHFTTLDHAANLGCRAGSLLDPGDNDEFIERVETRANDRMMSTLSVLGTDECATCDVDARTVGAPPQRTLVCRASRDVVPLVGLYYRTMTITSRQLARLEWQREAAES